VATPTLYRQDAIDVVVAALNTITAGADYRHTPVNVVNDMRAPGQIETWECPWVAVIGGDDTSSAQLSGLTADAMDIVLFLVMRPDEDRWPGKSAAVLIEEWKADVEKSVHADTSLGGTMYAMEQRSRVAHEAEGSYSIAQLVLNYKFKNRGRNWA